MFQNLSNIIAMPLSARNLDLSNDTSNISNLCSDGAIAANKFQIPSCPSPKQENISANGCFCTQSTKPLIIIAVFKSDNLRDAMESVLAASAS